jgi:hypothetical protein
MPPRNLICSAGHANAAGSSGTVGRHEVSAGSGERTLAQASVGCLIVAASSRLARVGKLLAAAGFAAPAACRAA